MNKSVIETKPKRCSECNKLLAEQNKSLLCNYHSTLINQRKRKRRLRESQGNVKIEGAEDER